MSTYAGLWRSYLVLGESRLVRVCAHCRLVERLHKSRHNANPRKRARCPK